MEREREGKDGLAEIFHAIWESLDEPHDMRTVECSGRDEVGHREPVQN